MESNGGTEADSNGCWLRRVGSLRAALVDLQLSTKVLDLQTRRIFDADIGVLRANVVDLFEIYRLTLAAFAESAEFADFREERLAQRAFCQLHPSTADTSSGCAPLSLKCRPYLNKFLHRTDGQIQPSATYERPSEWCDRLSYEIYDLQLDVKSAIAQRGRSATVDLKTTLIHLPDDVLENICDGLVSVEAEHPHVNEYLRFVCAFSPNIDMCNVLTLRSACKTLRNSKVLAAARRPQLVVFDRAMLQSVAICMKHAADRVHSAEVVAAQCIAARPAQCAHMIYQLHPAISQAFPVVAHREAGIDRRGKYHPPSCSALRTIVFCIGFVDRTYQSDTLLCTGRFSRASHHSGPDFKLVGSAQQLLENLNCNDVHFRAFVADAETDIEIDGLKLGADAPHSVSNNTACHPFTPYRVPPGVLRPRDQFRLAGPMQCIYTSLIKPLNRELLKERSRQNKLVRIHVAPVADVELPACFYASSEPFLLTLGSLQPDQTMEEFCARAATQQKRPRS